MGEATGRRTRSDAVHNRERIATAAREALAEDGSASLSAIAKRAGVGIGSLYRHFPTREALVMEVYRTDIGTLIDLAPTLADEHPPMEALRRWFGEVARYARLKYGVAEVIHAATNGALEDPAYEPFVNAIAVLLDAGERSGDLKAGVDPEDVLLQLSMLWRIDPAKDEGRSERLVGLIIDGLRASPSD
ncbi:TetR/AcrR family transcriptional regulator [Luteipulveratus mongoliensis]|uniref:TetR family transcriptional regulator n=1 Tax=Luteipulveratus mongoliensis TaxID=571913 RepID=A0A0K1JDF4_9MICO|nr:TetR/AcrR family transcriptional regulator [Luteipulveratus mongoliensis]AKU14726.1 TetR family transcriptional regulator [Luteipulveratus mongoliensis]